MLPDAVSCVVILNVKDQEPRLCLSREYRYPAGQFLLSVPAGLTPEDAKEENPVFHAAIRELREETGIALEESDSIRLVNPLVFSTRHDDEQCTGADHSEPGRNAEGKPGRCRWHGML